MLEKFLLALIPIFVAVDAPGILPIFSSLTEGMDDAARRQAVIQSMCTAIALAFGFIFLGKAIFNILGVRVSDFMVAGGIILFAIAIMDILNPIKRRRIPPPELGAVPLGTPLIVGPAVLTTSLIVREEYGLATTLVSIVINVFIAGLTFSFAGPLNRIIGVAGSKALSKVTSLLLAAIAVMLVRKGLQQIFL